MVHKLKILPEYYSEVVKGRKTFEIRNNDRNFKVGDRVHLKKIINDNYTGDFAEVVITYITNYEQKDNYVVFSIELKHFGFDSEILKENSK